MHFVHSCGDLMSRMVVVLEVMILFGVFRYLISCNIGVNLITCSKLFFDIYN